MADDFLVVAKTVRPLLLADATIAAGVSNQVFVKEAPSAATYPYCFIDMNASADDNSGGAALSDLRVLIKFVGRMKDYATLAALAGRVFGLLHEQAIGDVGEDWFIYRCQRVARVDYKEMDAEITFAHVGGVYRLRLNG